jgi:hypothetical protein
LPDSIVSSSYATEKAASLARRATTWAEAEREFDAWYKNVGTRAELTTNGHAGVQRGVTLTTSAKCWCGKATVALGMCINHYTQWWKRKHHVVIGYRGQPSICHPDRPNRGMGLCQSCYSREHQADTKFRQAVRRVTTDLVKLPRFRLPQGQTNAFDCPHPERPHHALGKCRSCYITHWKKHGRTRKKLHKLAWRCPHPDRKHHCFGLCYICYHRRRNIETGRTKGTRVRTRTHGIPLRCGHPDGRGSARGLCKKCYQRWLYRRKVRQERRKRIRATVATSAARRAG